MLFPAVSGERVNRPRVLIADDHESMRYVIRLVVETEFDVVGEAANGREALDAAEHLQPDVVLLDINMPVMDGFEAARRLREALPESRIILVSDHATPVYADEGFRVGAHGYVAKGTVATKLCGAIRTVLKGGRFRSAEVQSNGDGEGTMPR